MVNNFNKIRGIMKITCYCLFNTVTWDVFIYSPQDKIINEFIKWPVQKFTYPWILYSVSFPGWSTAVFLFCDSCSRVPCWSWAFTVIQTNPPAPAHSLVFQLFLQIWTLSNSDCMILRSIFSHGGQLWDSYITIYKMKIFTDAQDGNTMH